MVPTTGIEPATSSLQVKRTAYCATSAYMVRRVRFELTCLPNRSRFTVYRDTTVVTDTPYLFGAPTGNRTQIHRLKVCYIRRYVMEALNLHLFSYREIENLVAQRRIELLNRSV